MSKKNRKEDREKTKQDLQIEIGELREKVRQLQTELMLDDLTGLFNARHLRHRLTDAIERREELQPALLFVDVDYFKSVNEKHGHQTGGQLLNSVGRKIAELIRVDDMAFRYGGDEFVVLVSGGLEGATAIGERLRSQTESEDFHVNGLEGKGIATLTISVGIRVIRDGDTPQCIIDEADRAMFEAKRKSRNTLVAA